MKKIGICKYLIVITTVIASCLQGWAVKPVVKAKLDSAIVMMGKMTDLYVTIEQDKNTRGQFPIFNQFKETGIVPVCGDSVELRYPVNIDTVENGNNLFITYKIPVQSFDSGYYKLPELAFVVGVDTSFSNSVQLKVVPVNVTADTPINDYANVADPENSSIFDSVPDFVVNYWWLILLIVLLGGVGYYLYRKYKKEGHLLPKKPEPTPYEVAMRDLALLKDKKLWEQGDEKEYFTQLTDILRIYLFKRFGINAMEMTSRQILSSLSSNAETKEQKLKIRQILDMADFVKFAKVRPLPADNIASYDNALHFVEETKPVPVVEEPEPKKKSKKLGKKGGKK